MRLVSADHRRRSLPRPPQWTNGGALLSPSLWPNGGRAFRPRPPPAATRALEPQRRQSYKCCSSCLMLFFIAGLFMAHLTREWHVDALMRRAERREHHLARRFWRLLSHQQTTQLLRLAGPGYAPMRLCRSPA